MQVRQSSEVEHGKLNREEGAESKRVAEFQKSYYDHLRTMTEIVSESEEKIMLDMQRYMREEFGIDPTQLSSDVDELSGNGDRVSDDSTRTEVSSYDAKLQETREMLRQHEQIISETVRDGQQRLNATMKPLNQETVATLDNLLTQQGYDTSKFRTGTAGFRPGTSDSSELGRMADESTGDNSKCDDKGRHF